MSDEIYEPPGDLQELCKQAACLRHEIEEIDAKRKSVSGQYDTVTAQILRTLELMEIDSIKAHGFLFYTERKTSVTTPKTMEDKQLLFQFLRERGVFDELVSVNSQTLNSFYKDCAEQALKEGVLEFIMPGVGRPNEYVSLKLRKG